MECDHPGCTQQARQAWTCPCGQHHHLAWCTTHDRDVGARMHREGWDRRRIPA